MQNNLRKQLAEYVNQCTSKLKYPIAFPAYIIIYIERESRYTIDILSAIEKALVSITVQ